MFLQFIIVIIATCLLISTFAYVRIYLIVRHHQSQIQAREQAVESLNTEHNLNIIQSKKSALNTFTYYVCMFCVIPQDLLPCWFALYSTTN